MRRNWNSFRWDSNFTSWIISDIFWTEEGTFLRRLKLSINVTMFHCVINIITITIILSPIEACTIYLINPNNVYLLINRNIEHWSRNCTNKFCIVTITLIPKTRWSTICHQHWTCWRISCIKWKGSNKYYVSLTIVEFFFNWVEYWSIWYL
jgi:hypothetical protein